MCVQLVWLNSLAANVNHLQLSIMKMWKYYLCKIYTEIKAAN